MLLDLRIFWIFTHVFDSIFLVIDQGFLHLGIIMLINDRTFIKLSGEIVVYWPYCMCFLSLQVLYLINSELFIIAKKNVSVFLLSITWDKKNKARFGEKKTCFWAKEFFQTFKKAYHQGRNQCFAWIMSSDCKDASQLDHSMAWSCGLPKISIRG